MKKIAIVGFNGKMGKPIFLALEKNYEVIGIGRNDDLEAYSNLDLVIDVASASSSVRSAEYCLNKNIPIIIVSTGQTLEENNKLSQIAQQILLVKKANFSCCMHNIRLFIDEALNLNPCHVEIVEVHHVHKKDTPSGTALEIKKYIESKFAGIVEVVSYREGEIMGDHSISFDFGEEKLTLKHEVFSREVFVKGIVHEVKKIFQEFDN